MMEDESHQWMIQWSMMLGLELVRSSWSPVQVSHPSAVSVGIHVPACCGLESWNRMGIKTRWFPRLDCGYLASGTQYLVSNFLIHPINLWLWHLYSLWCLSRNHPRSCPRSSFKLLCKFVMSLRHLRPMEFSEVINYLRCRIGTSQNRWTQWFRIMRDHHCVGIRLGTSRIVT
jgi:hypothetical protein